MLRDVFYYGSKPNVHPREQHAESLTDARQKATTRDFWIINEFCDYRNFDWDFDFEFLPDEDVWAEEHNNVWPSQHQKDSGTWLCPKEHSDIIIYRCDVDPVNRKNEKQSENWVELDLIDHSKFDFSWHPDPTDPPYIYKWGCKYFPAQFKHVLEYRVPNATQEKYMDTVVELLPEWEKWEIPNNIDKNKFDFAWRPDPRDSPLIYEFGTQWQRNGGPIYKVPGATDIKYTNEQKAKKIPSFENWTIPTNIDLAGFDFSWHPDATSPPYTYVFATQWAFSGGPIYTVPNSIETKYIDDQVAAAKVDMTNWEYDENEIDVSSFDFSWHPHIEDQPYIYQFGTQWQKTGGPKYIVPGATSTSSVKYVDTRILKATRLVTEDPNWHVLAGYNIKDFDFSWHPDDTSPPYNYVFGNNLYPAEECATIEYRVPGATQIKYVHDIVATLGKNINNWVIPENLDVTNFDFNWVPNPTDGIYVYEFGTQWQKTGGPKYVVPGATEIKYVEGSKANHLPNKDKFRIASKVNVEDFDFSWHPDATSPPYNYVFGNQWYSAEEMPTVTYRMSAAKESTYINDLIATIGPNMKNWEVPDDVVLGDFDFSWLPHPKAPPYIYQFATQWQKTGGPKYVVPGATEVNYISTPKVTKVPNKENWVIPDNVVVDDFDFSWHPDDTEQPYIYKFGTQWAITGGPTYIVPGATEIKYSDVMTATARPCMDNWEIPDDIVVEDFDFSWHPYAEDDPFIYQFGTQWQKTGGPRYVAPGADNSSPVKYIDTRISKATRLPNKSSNWEVLYDIVDFDFSWHPDDTAPPYVYVFGNQWYPAEEMPTIEYVVEGAIEKKYINDLTATLSNNMDNWEIPISLDVSSFDFSWVPHPDAPPYIYQFGTQWQKTGGPRYVVENATDINYISTPKAKKLPNTDNWEIPSNIDAAKFDFSWHPDDTAPPYIYVFATQWALSGGPKYIMPGATEIKYIEDQIATALPDMINWDYNENEIDVASFDFSWHPYAADDPYIYQFGTQHQKTGGPRYMVSGAEKVKYVDTRILKAKRLPNKNNWEIPDNIKINQFDFSWHPDDTAPPYVYVFGNQLYPADEMATVKYIVPGATETKFVMDITAKLGFNMSNWEIPDNIDVKLFDFSWVPHPMAPPYIYQFGTLADPSDGPRYITPNNNGEIVRLPRIELDEIEVELPPIENTIKKYYIETTLEDLIIAHQDEIFWALNTEVDYTMFDFTWRPSIDQAEYVHVFGQSASIKSQTYYVNAPLWAKGFTEFNFVEKQQLTGQLDMFFVDKGNIESSARFEALKAKFGTHLQKTRYLNSWVDTIKRCTNRATSSLIWVLNSELDYTDFEFDYYPNPWQMKMVHVFGTQWSHWGTTFMVNRETFSEDTKYINVIEHLSNLNFIKDHRSKATQCVHDIVLIDHGNKETNIVYALLEEKAGNKIVNVVKYDQSYLNTIKDVIRRQVEKKEHYLWICSSVCDYTNFDFSYIVDPFAKDQLHVFPSGVQKFGDTFFIDVNKAREVIADIEHLEDFNKVNYNGSVKATRLPEPIIITNDDTHVNAALNVTGFPYATIITSDNKDIQTPDIEPMNLWSSETKNIIVTSTGATRIIVPTEAKDYIKKELYDYPYIKRSPKLIKSSPIDIVFLSNGEAGADANWEHLLSVTNGLPNRVVRVDGVNGRAAAYHAAAEASNTPWMFTVFAKLKVSNKFDWNWQPDRMQVPKHYIFHAKNPVNGLTYGHQAMIAYNKKITLANEGRGLDFTLDDAHEIVPLISGTAHYNTDAFSTWRTAFREVLKLRADDSEESRDRLDAWLNKGEGDFGQFSIKGALDADEYYDEVNGDFNALKLSYEWDWLRKRFDEL